MLPDDPNKTANLLQSLTVAVGMMYDITVNVNVEDGLANGSTCVVKHIEYKMKQTSRPSIIWVSFSDKKVGCATRETYRAKGFYHDKLDSNWTPIFDIERSFLHNFKTFQRIQFPLRPSAGKTVHKAQGSTLDEVVVDLSQTRVRKNPHIHYVACSRPTTFKGLHILNFNEDALAVDEKVNVEMSRLRNDSILDLCYIPLYDVDSTQFKLVFNNVRSLHKHINDINHDQNILCADIIGLAETRLCQNDEDRL